MSHRRAIVLGGGIQGTCVALQLHKQGCAVELVDKGSDCLQFASCVNEGKIHLGHVYAKDASLRTARLMLKSALRFAPLLEDCLETSIDWESIRSNPFFYVVAADSMVSVADLMAHYERLDNEFQSYVRDRDLHYLGSWPRSMWETVPVPHHVNKQFAKATVMTPERSVDRGAISQLIRQKMVACDRIDTLYHHHVYEVSRTSLGFRVAGTRSDGTSWQRSADIVVNCLWEGRLKLDEQMGVLPAHERMHRLKYRVLAELPVDLSDIPSMTFVLGPYGDLVTYPGTRVAYVSWYPCCLQDRSAEIAPPSSWAQHFAGNSEASWEIAQETLQALDTIVPGIKRSRIQAVNAGAIFSWGKTDIDDPSSELHERHDIGVREHDGYFTIDTGKYTSAPMFAKECAMRVSS